MAHKSETELLGMLESALSLVEVGATYSHYKDPQKLYIVRTLTFSEADDSVMVVYEALYGNHFSFVRPLYSWLETVPLDGVDVPRFKKKS